MTYQLIQLAPGAYDLLLHDELMGSVVRVKTKQGATWYAELLEDLPPIGGLHPSLRSSTTSRAWRRCVGGLAIRRYRPTIGTATRLSAEHRATERASDGSGTWHQAMDVIDRRWSPMIHQPGSIVADRLPNRTPGHAQGLNLSALDLARFCHQGWCETVHAVDAQAGQGFLHTDPVPTGKPSKKRAGVRLAQDCGRRGWRWRHGSQLITGTAPAW